MSRSAFVSCADLEIISQYLLYLKEIFLKKLLCVFGGTGQAGGSSYHHSTACQEQLRFMGHESQWLKRE